MSVIYMIDGKPHRLCDCSFDTPHCPRGASRQCQSAGYNQCLIPASDAVLVPSSESEQQGDPADMRWNEQKQAFESWVPVPEEKVQQPIDMLLFCPRCNTQHVDAPQPERGWTNPPHATHTCQHCGLLWRPSNENTNGVAEIACQEPKHAARISASFPSATTASENMEEARLAWVRDLAKANLPYPGNNGLMGFAAGFDDGFAAGAAPRAAVDGTASKDGQGG